ncbi:MAG: carboxylesterase family protein [Prevotella sp.]|nr:carboxylesterase family protein [Prevotella sp.]
MEVFHHIRYASAGRFESPVVSSSVEPEAGGDLLTSFPQGPFRLDKVMGENQPLRQDEDAHYLSIYTPSREGSRPVLFWIHGGAFIAGSGEENTYDASALSQEGDIVVVTVSYRLGVLGYLYDENLPCQDMGLKDQIAALRWVHQNIHQFGGDASRVTIAGQSAGGYSVAAMLQEVREPLFQRAIIQSAPFAIKTNREKASSIARRIESILGKPLAEATSEEILEAQASFLAHTDNMMPFEPVVPDLNKPIQTASLEKVLITWQKDDLSPFVELRLGGNTPMKRRLNLRLSTLLSFLGIYLPSKSFAKRLRKQGVKAEVRQLDWRPEGSHYGACHCLELALLFGDWSRWQGVGMLGKTSREEWLRRGKQLRSEWIEFIQ